MIGFYLNHVSMNSKKPDNVESGSISLLPNYSLNMKTSLITCYKGKELIA